MKKYPDRKIPAKKVVKVNIYDVLQSVFNKKIMYTFSFGYCEKTNFSTPGHQAVGQYGNGFKSGSMRLGKDAIVFTRTVNSMSVGLLSQTYLHNIKAETVLVPIVTWGLPDSIL